jgi:hypothetical protein
MEDHKSPHSKYDRATGKTSDPKSNNIEFGGMEISNQPGTEALDLDMTNPEEDDFGGYRIHDEGPEPNCTGKLPNRNDKGIVESDEIVEVTPIPTKVYVATFIFDILGACLFIAA